MIAREFPPSSGGIGYYVHNLSRKLLERGHRITVLTHGPPTKTIREVVDGINVIKVSFFPLYPLHIQIHGVFVNMVLKSLNPRPDIVHLHTPLPPPIKTPVPIMTTVHTPMKVDARYHEMFDLFSLAERVQSMVVYPPIELKLLRMSTKITAVSLSVAMELKEYGLNPNEVTVVGNGVDEKAFVPLQNKKSSGKYISYVGVLRSRKGLFDLLECAKYVCEAESNVKFVICGTGPFRHKLEDRVRRMRLEKQIVFQGHVTTRKLIQIYQNAAVHVIPSHYEGLSTVLLEAMSCGAPIVATDIGANGEVIKNGVNGFLVPAKSPEAMAQTILKLLDNDALRERLGASSRKTIEKCYTWDKVTDNILKCYENTLEKSDAHRA